MGMNKGFILLFCLILFSSFVSAFAITNYSVPSSIPLDQVATATGVYSGAPNTLCSFYFLDANTGVLVKRATDQYTTDSGRFTLLNTIIKEPLFKRGQSYTVRTECGSSVADSNFVVGQLEDISQPMKWNFEYLTKPQNTDTIFIWGIILGAFVLIIMAFLSIVFMKVRK